MHPPLLGNRLIDLHCKSISQNGFFVFLMTLELHVIQSLICFNLFNYYSLIFFPKTLKYWVGVQQGQSYFMGRRYPFSLGWPLFYSWCHNKNILWDRCFTLTSFAPHLFLLGWLKLNLALLLDQLRLA